MTAAKDNEQQAMTIAEMQAQDQQLEAQMLSRMLAMREQQVARREAEWRAYVTPLLQKK